MDANRRSSSSDRYFILFSPPPGSDTHSSNLNPHSGSCSKPVADDPNELQEDEIFSTNTGSGSDQLMLSRTHSMTNPTMVPASRRHISLPETPSGILGLLHDTKQMPTSASSNSLHRKATIASATSAKARMIPAPKPKAKEEFSVHYKSAPLNIPVGPPRKPSGGIWFDGGEGEEDEYTNGSEMLPPHDIVARRLANTPMTASSCLEGAGRTLKGRDLRRVRNAILRNTGFLDGK